MNKTVAVILAAGRGSRMGPLTSSLPKCLLPLAGRPLLHWQLEALRRAGVGAVLVVTGYLGHLLLPKATEGARQAYDVAENPAWADTNMLSTLQRAAPWLTERFAQGVEQAVISYADIVYRAGHVADLVRSPGSLAVTYDTQWEALWRLRFGDPLLDAETFRQRDGLLLEIGGKPASMEEVGGQYMGLFKCTPEGWADLTAAYHALGAAAERTDMTGFFGICWRGESKLEPCRWTEAGCEADSGEDLAKYSEALRAGGWTHDFRL